MNSGKTADRLGLGPFHHGILLLVLLLPAASMAQRPAQPPPSSDIVEILADSQQKEGEIYLLLGNVEIRHRGMLLHADEVTYDERNRTVEARGHVVFEQEDDRVEASQARYNLRTGEGTFVTVSGTVGPSPRPSRDYLVTSNPYYFEAERVERRGDGSYWVENGWVTNCEAGKPKWRLKAARAKIRPGQDVQLHRTSFLLRGVPIFFSPYWWISAAERPRKTGFLMPSFGSDSRRGTNFGDSFFWAINPHMDLLVGAQFFNEGGWTQSAEFRALPTENSTITVSYLGAIAGKLGRSERRRGEGLGVDQSGQFAKILAMSRWKNGFRAVADLNWLSSFRFRQRFAETFNEAVISEVRAEAFVANNPDTLYLNLFFDRYQNFLQVEPESSITLLAAPGVEFGTRPRLLEWLEGLPIYFSFDSQVAGMSRNEPRFETPELVQRFDFYPRVTIPLRLGRYFSLVPTLGMRATRYSSRLIDDPSQPGGKRVLNDPIRRITEEVSVDLEFPTFARIFETRRARYKHTIEPEVIYRYLNGVHAFNEILRFDERDVLTDTHEVEYALTQRLFLRPPGEGQHVREIVRWRLAQKYYFDPTFRGALEPGRRNLFAALNSLTPFAFADEPRRFSPIVSDLTFNWRRYDTNFRFDYDQDKSKLVNTQLRVGVRLTPLLHTTLGHYSTRNSEILQPRSNQLRLLARYGSLFRRGVNAAVLLNWNIQQDFLQDTVTQVSYNWDCCGVGFEFRRLGLGAVRSENEFRFSFTIANVGSFGTIDDRRRIF